MSSWRFGCGEKFQAFVPRGYDYREITVTCGSTSPTGDPWQCDDCAEKHEGTDYRADAESFGESYGDDGFFDEEVW